MAGTLAGTDGWFTQARSQVSAQYGVGLNGDVHQYVSLANSAWANGVLEDGNRWPADWCSWPNGCTISIETEDNGNADTPVSDQEYAGVVACARAALLAHPTITHLLGHRDISPKSRANCPGDRWYDSGRFAALAADLGLEMVG